MTHKELVEIGRKWLSDRLQCQIVITEMSLLGMNEPDVIGWRHGHSILLECKTSSADFVADRQKRNKRFPQEAVGEQRYYLTVEGLLRKYETRGTHKGRDGRNRNSLLSIDT